MTPRYFQRLPVAASVDEALDHCAGAVPVLHAGDAGIYGVVEINPNRGDEHDDRPEE